MLWFLDAVDHKGSSNIINVQCNRFFTLKCQLLHLIPSEWAASSANYVFSWSQHIRTCQSCSVKKWASLQRKTQNLMNWLGSERWSSLWIPAIHLSWFNSEVYRLLLNDDEAEVMQDKHRGKSLKLASKVMSRSYCRLKNRFVLDESNIHWYCRRSRHGSTT